MPIRKFNARQAFWSRMGTSLCAAAITLVASMLLAADPIDDKQSPSGTATEEAGGESAAKAHPLEEPLLHARESLKAISEVKDYTATFDKKELVGNRLIPHQMHMKFRSEPFSVYLHFLKAHQGREVLYVAGQNRGRLKAHEGSGIKSIVTVDLEPTSRDAMAEGRHPITEIGMQKMIESVIRQWEMESKFGEITVEKFDSPETKVNDVECIAFRCTHPVKRDQFPFHQTIVYIAKETKFPVRVEQYGFPPRPGADQPLIEEYTYTNIQVNVGLNAQDFDHRNRQYRF